VSAATLISGQFIIVGSTTLPAVILLDAGALALLNDRERVAGRERALQYTFGNDINSAFPVTWGMLAYLMEHAVRDNLQHANQLAAIAAAIATGKPIGNGQDYSDRGGQRIEARSRVPRKPAPAGGTFSSVCEASVVP
jgi:hypothetical protein